MRDRIYENFLAQFQALLRAVRPEMEEAEVQKKGFVVMCIIDGMNRICGPYGDLKKRFNRELPGSVDQIMQIIDG